MYRLFRLFLILSIFSCANVFERNYPNTLHLFAIFDIDESYLYDDGFISFVDNNQNGLRAFYDKSLSRGIEVIPTIESIIALRGMTPMFLYISMVESGFVVNAISSKKAVGLWQFMPNTAREYNLIVSDEYDERLDSSKSTTSAMLYLNRLHRRFGKWYLAIMAYNCGEGRLSKAIAKAGSDDLSVLSDDRLKYLPKETRDYIRKILLVSMISQRVEEGVQIPFVAMDMNITIPKYETMKVDITADANLSYIASVIGMEADELHTLNKSFVAKKPQTINIPKDKIYAFYLTYELHKRTSKDKDK